jgi:putative glycerol-1-phosphate prenyltransferase
MKNILSTLELAKKEHKKLLAVLIDPDKFHPEILDVINHSKVDFIFVGGSIITQGNLQNTILEIKKKTNKPVIIFPSNASHVCDDADAFLLLSLLSGRNPEYLVSQHVQAAPLLHQSSLETISVSYILVDGGNKTSVAYISNTQPIPADKPEIIWSTALAGQLIGHQLCYLEAGSGATNHVSEDSIKMVRAGLKLPLLVGGGIRNAQTAKSIWDAGADCIIVGNAAESNAQLLQEISEVKY